ncbi:TetR/AcrR family transcriptional regulator [Paenibacillus algorifonticola]|uniref:TetR/AcrR family transcriptional regulator n=1 Tax=Paenibacillus algorifonticola TaxID=684063 RepID=UPI003D296A9A
MKTKQSNREIALHTAQQLFLSKGYLVTSMDDIVAASKVSKTNIYYYFKSKEELLSAIIERMISQYESLFQHISGQTDTPVLARLDKLVQLLTEQDARCLGGCPFLTLYTQAPLENGPFREQFRRFFQSQLSFIEQLLHEGIARKELKSDLPVEPTAALMLSTIEGALFLQHASQNPNTVQHAFHALAALLK